jgi:hypothetical protein
VKDTKLEVLIEFLYNFRETVMGFVGPEISKYTLGLKVKLTPSLIADGVISNE